jgi:hypothetical protein
MAAAAQEADRIHEQRLMGQAAPDRLGTTNDVSPTQNAPDSRAERKRKQDILDEHKRWRGTRLDDHPELDVPTEHHHVDRSGRQHGTVIQNCNTAPGGAMTCFGSDGSIANGQATPGGEATMFGTDGSIHQLHGVSGNATTFCDANGFCN